MTWIKKHAPWLLTLAAGSVAFLDPSVQAYTSAHPQSAALIGALWAVAAAWAKSPRQ